MNTPVLVQVVNVRRGYRRAGGLPSTFVLAQALRLYSLHICSTSVPRLYVSDDMQIRAMLQLGRRRSTVLFVVQETSSAEMVEELKWSPSDRSAG
jgi:hypothetical protein